MIALGFTGLGARAAYIQIFNNDFFQRQGVVRFARTIELPANRGRVLDRNGLILASSVPAASIWAIPEDVDITPAQSQKLAKLLDMRVEDLSKKWADEDKTFVWVKRQVDSETAKAIGALELKGIHQSADYLRQYPEGESAAHIVGYSCANDVTAIELLNRDPSFPQWTRAKGFDGFGVVGPVIETDFDLSQASLRTRVGGRERQNYPLADMIFKPDELVSMISQDLTLEPGDVILCGTSIGVLPMKPGSLVEVEIDGIGLLANTFG
jgi:hypothetical protein